MPRELTDTEQQLLALYDAMKVLERQRYAMPRSALEEIAKILPNWRLDSILSCFDVQPAIPLRGYQPLTYIIRLNPRLPGRMDELFRVLQRHVEDASY